MSPSDVAGVDSASLLTPKVGAGRLGSGTLHFAEAYGTRIGIEIKHDMGWLDIGVVDALVPDTARSRNPGRHLLFWWGGGAFSTSSARASASRSRRCGSAGSAGGRAPAYKRDYACRARPAASGRAEHLAPRSVAREGGRRGGGRSRRRPQRTAVVLQDQGRPRRGVGGGAGWGARRVHPATPIPEHFNRGPAAFLA